MRKILLPFFILFALTSCFGGDKEVTQTESGATDTGAVLAPSPEVKKVTPPEIEKTESTTTIKPKTSNQSVTTPTPASTPDTNPDPTDTELNAASEEKMVSEFEAEIEDLLKLIENDAK